MRQWNKETIEEQLKLHKKQKKDERYNYFASEFNSLWYCWELEKYTINKQKQLDQLTNNWNELEEWVKEYMRKNEKWYTNELSTHDKQYYGDTYYTTNAVLMTILDKMKEIKEKSNER